MRTPKVSNSWLAVLCTLPGVRTPEIDTSFLTPRAAGVFNGGVKVFKQHDVNLRGALAEAPNSKQLLVWLTGLGEVSEKWVDEVARLKEQGISVLVIEPPGIGLSTNPSAPGVIRLGEAVEYFRNLFCSSEFERLIAGRNVALGGHSTGAHIALHYALRFPTLYNANFSGMVLNAPAIDFNADKGTRSLAATLYSLGLGWFSPPESKDLAANPLTNDLQKLASWKGLQRRFASRMFLGGIRTKGTIGFAYNLMNSGHKILGMAKNHKYQPSLWRIDGPVHFIYGSEDRLIPQEKVTRVAGQIGAAVHRIEGARHEPHLDSGATLNAFRTALDAGLAAARPADVPKPGSALRRNDDIS